MRILFKTAQILVILFLIAILIPFGLYLSLSPARTENVSFGYNFSNKYAQELDLDWRKVFDLILAELPSKKFRLVVYWNDVQPVKGSYNYSDIKYQLDKLEKYPDSEVIMVIGRKVIRYPECHEPGWWQNIRDENEREKELLTYIEKTVNELKGYKSIKYWQVENEALFPFGECTDMKNLRGLLKQEVELVRKLDPTRQIIIQDSGEGGFWKTSNDLGDIVGISMYRKVWFDFGGTLDNWSFQIKYPVGASFYKIKADLLGIPFEKIKATEVQAEPWGPVRNYLLTTQESDKSMSQEDFDGIIEFTRNSGFKEAHLWGVEWWYHMKVFHNKPYYWEKAKNNFK